MPLFRWLRTSLKIPSDPPGKDSKGNGVDDCDLIIRSRPEFGGGSVRLPPCVARWTRPPLPTTCVWPSWTWARASTVAIGTVAKDSQCVSSKCTLQLDVGGFYVCVCVDGRLGPFARRLLRWLFGRPSQGQMSRGISVSVRRSVVRPTFEPKGCLFKIVLIL